MARTILFRGYNSKNKMWLYGFYLQNRGAHFVCPDEFANGKTWEDYEIDPDTLGQFTGQKDADGTNIFEGDILQSLPEEEYINKLSDGRFHSRREAMETPLVTLSAKEMAVCEVIREGRWNYNTRAVVRYTECIFDLVETETKQLARHFFLNNSEYWRVIANIHSKQTDV